MRLCHLYIALIAGMLLSFSVQACNRIAIQINHVGGVEQTQEKCFATVLSVDSSNAELPSTDDDSQDKQRPIPSLSSPEVLINNGQVTTITPLTFAVVIALFSHEEPRTSIGKPDGPLATDLRKVFLRTIISPNAP